LIAKLYFTRGTAPQWHGQKFERYNGRTNGQRHDIADGDGQATLFHPTTVDADTPGFRPILGESPALGKSQKEQKFVDPQLRLTL
jgi:hypothetical protein